jgi:hypothetical protein
VAAVLAEEGAAVVEEDAAVEEEDAVVAVVAVVAGANRLCTRKNK